MSVNPVDVKVRRSSPPKGIGVLGFDAAGAMRGIGGEISLFRPGDAKR
ncbi:oxidoreductase [Bifidobacterium minimum]|uniref:Oxidoreductase n=1 Tax=Bifidobacterium minimum TaxID=1693 RepID=A0A087BQE8_9BIFI|nr:oxidoreductase [Bifidobacterium minimum]